MTDITMVSMSTAPDPLFFDTDTGLAPPPSSASSPSNFFDTYYSPVRFCLESCLAFLAVMLNVVALTAMLCGRTRRHSLSLYNILFVNLSVANVLSCCLFLLSNNALVLLQRLDLFRFDICLFFIHMLAAIFLSSAFSIITILTMFAFSIIQYLAICRPLQQLHVLRRKNIYIFVGFSWVLAFIFGLVPYLVALLIGGRGPCEDWFVRILLRISAIETNICTVIVGLFYLFVVTVSARIYAEIRSGRLLMIQIRAEHDLRGERRAYFTILFLLSTLTLFLVPYMIVHLLSLNFSDSRFLHNPLVIYYMNMLPYLKYMTDPIIYGLRMRELKNVCTAVKVTCCRRCGCHGDAPPSTPGVSRATTISRYRRSSFVMTELNPQN